MVNSINSKWQQWLFRFIGNFLLHPMQQPCSQIMVSRSSCRYYFLSSGRVNVNAGNRENWWPASAPDRERKFRMTLILPSDAKTRLFRDVIIRRNESFWINYVTRTSLPALVFRLINKARDFSNFQMSNTGLLVRNIGYSFHYIATWKFHVCSLSCPERWFHCSKWRFVFRLIC